MPFQAGQHVELIPYPNGDIPYSYGFPGTQLGDRFTVILADDGKLMLLPHKGGSATSVAACYCRRVEYNPEPAGVLRASYDTVQALSTVLHYEMPSAMHDVVLDLERARMTAEDFRQGNGPCWDSGASWRKHLQFGEDAHEEAEAVRDEAITALSCIREHLRPLHPLKFRNSKVTNAIEQIQLEADGVLGEESDEDP